MARMIPNNGPVTETGSINAEPDIYWRLAKQLPDDFVVIHSIPWLSAVARQIDGRPVPTGEIDFLILHRTLGLLAVEVKGGVFGYDRTSFVYLRTGKKIDPIRQVRRGTHGLAEWLKAQGGPGLRIGYAILFPDSEFIGQPLPPSLIDPSVSPPQKLVFGKGELSSLGEKIIEVMQYWKEQLSGWVLSEQQIEDLIDIICPVADYSPRWQARIEDDNRTWLKLTADQSKCLQSLIDKPRYIITGWPGTGKTLLAIALARQLAHSNQAVLLLTYNVQLAGFLREQLKDSPQVKVLNFHELCREAERLVRLNGTLIPETSSKDWYDTLAIQALQKAVETGKLPSYDALIVDEAQAFNPSWWEILTQWMKGKRIAAFCDETQVFDFETPTPLEGITKLISSEQPYILTLNLRSPRAVFNRLQQVRQSSYQQYNPRTQEPDTLTEFAVDNPILQLREILFQLKAENIPSEAVTILHSQQRLPESALLEDYPVKFTSIAKFRGLESPIVIIYAIGRPSDVSLFCGYSRATSRCIVIYSAYEITIQSCGTFGQILLDSEAGPTIRQESDTGFTANMVQCLSLSMKSIASKTGTIKWCHDWVAWTVTGSSDLNTATELWLDHMSLITQAPIYHWNLDFRGQLYRLNGPALLTDSRKSDFMVLDQCEICATVTPHFVDVEKLTMCSFCKEGVSPHQHAQPPEEANSLEEFDNILNSPEKDVSGKIKRQMTISLIALGRWRALGEPEQNSIAPVVGGGCIGYRAALILAGRDIVRAKPGEELILDQLANRYYSWSALLSEQVPLIKWRSMVAIALSTWKQRDWIGKRDKGVFYRK